ncbi:MAG: hypothetical protein MI724_16355 [Spirochaetales bacterium]|nr:hypothetical protein [Spirochaetales bacterium]
MKCYIGIDVGTTNTKVLTLMEDGTTEIAAAMKTPIYTENGVEFFDMGTIERCVSQAIEGVAADHTVAGICVDSVGESAIPLDGRGRKLCDPIVWYDPVTRTVADRLEREPDTFPYERRGVRSEYTFGIYKILWMREHGMRDAACWLPVSGYLAYRWTGITGWDFSQGCRSFLVDIHRREWDGKAVRRFDLRETLPALSYMGAFSGTTSHGSCVYAGGHDHIVGMNGIRILFGTGTIYDSMGSSSVLGGMVRVRPTEMIDHLRRADDMIVGVGYNEETYYVENSTRYYGALLNAVAKLVSPEDTENFFTTMNAQLGPPPLPDELPLFLVEGDRVTRHAIEGWRLMELGINISRRTVVWGLYYYLALMTAMIYEELRTLFVDSTLVAGGGVTDNRLLMQLIADTIRRPIALLKQREVTALGAALTAAEGAGDVETIAMCRAATELVTVEPSPLSHMRVETAETLHRRMTAAWRCVHVP